MSLDIIIPTFNNFEELKACLEGLARQTFTDFRVIVCVDGSTDGTSSWLAEDAKHPFPVTVATHSDGLRHGRNATRNLALPFLNSEILLLLDSDSVPTPDLLEKHLACVKKNDGVSVGMMAYTNTKDNLWARYLMGRGRCRLPHDAPIGYHLFNSGNAAFGTLFFKELGGQDGAMSHYGGGDTEFAIRLFDRFHPSFFNNKKAVATSVMNKTLSEALVQMVEFGAFNLKYLYEKHPAHRHLYGMTMMKKYWLVFALINNRQLFTIVKSIVALMPGFLQNAIIRYLVVASVYQGFSSRKSS